MSRVSRKYLLFQLLEKKELMQKKQRDIEKYCIDQEFSFYSYHSNRIINFLVLSKYHGNFSDSVIQSNCD